MNLRLFALLSIFLIYACASQSYAQSFNESEPTSNYVVIGAFAVHKNAMRFTSYAKKKKFQARYEMNPNRNLYYVYVLKTDDLSSAVDAATQLREKTEFYDAWVYKGAFRLQSEHPEMTVRVVNKDINPVSEVNYAGPPYQQPLIETAQTVVEEPVLEKEKEEVKIEDEGDNSVEEKSFIFELVRANDNRIIEGEVEVIDTDRSRKMGSFKSHMPVTVSSPKSKSGKISVIPQAFGYRKVQKDFDFANPEGEDIARDSSNNIVVPFELIRLQKGDISVMYNVYFYKDAGIMRPESKYEVNSLLDMMKENPNYKIRIHGHTNGNAPGKIISLEKGATNFFSLTGAKEGFGSAKQLSQERAHTILEYLASNGIDPKRMQIKAWGGKRPIHDKNSTKANENVRVEVEILEH